MLERGGRRGACFPAVDLAEEVLLSSAKQLVGELPSFGYDFPKALWGGKEDKKKMMKKNKKKKKMMMTMKKKKKIMIMMMMTKEEEDVEENEPWEKKK